MLEVEYKTTLKINDNYNYYIKNNRVELNYLNYLLIELLKF